MEAKALRRLWWIATLVEREKGQHRPSYFARLLITLQVLLATNLRGKPFVEKEGQKVPLLDVYHHKTWEAQKNITEQDFKGSGTQRVVIGTCALGMWIHFCNVKNVVHHDAPQSVTEIIQQAGRAGRSGQEAYSFVYATKCQLS